MSYLFNIENRKCIPVPETLLLSPFKEIWERDRDKDKRYAIEDLTYVEFVTSLKRSNPFSEYPEREKKKAVRENVITRKGWVEDDLIKSAISKMNELQERGSVSLRYYQSAVVAAEKMNDFFHGVDLTARNDKTGLPLYKPGDVTKALVDTEKVLSNLDSLRKKVDEELYETSRTRAGKEISPFAERF